MCVFLNLLVMSKLDDEYDNPFPWLYSRHLSDNKLCVGGNSSEA